MAFLAEYFSIAVSPYNAGSFVGLLTWKIYKAGISNLDSS
jgi:hypothetical protein